MEKEVNKSLCITVKFLYNHMFILCLGHNANNLASDETHLCLIGGCSDADKNFMEN